jgi:hypothetical protein
MSKAETIIKRVPRKRKYIYKIHSTCHGLGRNDYIYDHSFPALMRYLILALADPLRHDYIELVREHRL